MNCKNPVQFKAYGCCFNCDKFSFKPYSFYFILKGIKRCFKILGLFQKQFCNYAKNAEYMSEARASHLFVLWNGFSPNRASHIFKLFYQSCSCKLMVILIGFNCPALISTD